MMKDHREIYDTLQKSAAQKRKKNSRENRTPEEKTRDRITDNERKKRGRKRVGELHAIYPCTKCWTFFKRKHYAKKCVCHAVFLFTSICFILYWLTAFLNLKNTAINPAMYVFRII